MTLILKHVYIDKLDDIVNKYNKTYHSTIKMKPADIKNQTHVLPLVNKLMIKIQNLKLVTMLESRYIRMFLQKISIQLGLKMCLWLKSLKKYALVINDLNGEEIVSMFYQKEFQKANQREFWMEKVIKRKSDKLYAKWQGYDDSFNGWMDKKP